MITKENLEDIYRLYTKRGLVSPDPLQFLYNYNDPADIEVVALTGACFAYGNVKQIIKTIDKILLPMGKSPRRFLLDNDAKSLAEIYKGFKYRFTTEEELISFLLAIKSALKEYGSLQNLMLSCDGDFIAKQRNFAAVLRSYGKIDTLVPNPAKNSALKRLNLCFRWLIRKDAVDLGCWSGISPACLIVPLDVHMHRVARMLGLTKRNQADMRTAQEISASLAKFCPEDPVKYDFCLTRFGIRDDMSEEELAAKFSTASAKKK